MVNLLARLKLNQVFLILLTKMVINTLEERLTGKPLVLQGKRLALK
jgi:hypothetical protein